MNYRVTILMDMFALSLNEAKYIDVLLRAIVLGKEADDTEQILKLISNMIGGYGVETIQSEKLKHTVYYINMGDTYDTTILVPTHSYHSYIETFGDYVERHKL